MQELDGFQYATASNLNMGYYTIRLDSYLQEMCSVINHWGKYKYLRLRMGIMCAPDTFQEKMSTLIEDIEFAPIYLNNLLCQSKDHFNTRLRVYKSISLFEKRKHDTSKSSFSRTDI